MNPSRPNDPFAAPQYGMPGSVEPQEEPLPILEYAQLLWYRKWTIIAITLLAGISGWVWVNQQTPIYRAESTMMIGGSSLSGTSPDTMWMAYYNRLQAPDEIQVLQSRSMAERVVERLDLLSYPEFNPALRAPEEPGLLDALRPRNWIPESWRDTLKAALDREPQKAGQGAAIERDREQRQFDTAVSILMGGLDISSLEMSNVIVIGFRSTNPRIAALIANELPEVYMVSTLQAKYDATEKASKWLSEQLNDLRQEVEDAEHAVEMYRNEHGLTDVGGSDLLTEQLSRLNSELIIARAERAEAEVRLRQVARLAQQSEAGAESAARLLNSAILQQLRTQELKAQQAISELAAEYGPRHPRMLQARAELEQIQQRIAAELSQIETSLSSELEFARAREESLEASLREAQQATGEQNREEIQLRALEREASASRALFETFLEQFKQTTASEGMNDPGARVLSAAQVPGAPVYPNVRRQTLVITFGGLVVAVLLVFGLEALNPGLTHPEQIEKQLHLHTLGIIPLTKDKTPAYDKPLDEPQSQYVEAINTLKVSLSLTDPDHEPRVIQVTSSVPAEGKTTLAVSLARVLAQKDQKVILVDADLRRSSVRKKLGLASREKGLTDFVLEHHEETTDFLVKDPRSNVLMMPTGTARFANATDIFSSQRMRRIIEVLRKNADYVIVDAPPVMAVADARLIGRIVDKTLFVVHWNKTPAKVVKAALKTLLDGGTDVAGVVLQNVDLKRYGQLGYGDSGYYYHYGRYGNYYQS
ncbi:MAG: polysaccharide biosynthesis tyrosine autokinase [Xanthomonadales bacterium]|nr:polysaccharide biosynthesis tyrosine autokinase [Xanthomonadales bacterium]